MDSKEENQIVANYLSLRKIRYNTRKSNVHHQDGSLITSVVYTAPTFAKKIIDYFSPQFQPGDTFLDPCAGHDAFFQYLPDPKDWCEIQRDKDFLQYNQTVDWIFANYPWRGKIYSELAKKGFQVAKNVVSLVKLCSAVGTPKRIKDAQSCNMQIKEIIFVNWKEAGFRFSDGSSKDPEGFLLSIIHYQKNWGNGTSWNSWL
jgi:hypothetical protein